jgi:hypothetical protein
VSLEKCLQEAQAIIDVKGLSSKALSSKLTQPAATSCEEDLYGGFTIVAIYFLGEHLLELVEICLFLSVFST